MKRLNWLMALMMVFSLSFVACGDDNVDKGNNNNGGNETVDSFFDVEITGLTYSSVAFTVVPDDTLADYLCVLYTQEEVDEFPKDEYLVLSLFQELEADARLEGKTIEEYLPSVLDHGILEDEIKNLYAATDYCLVLMTVDLANENATAELTKVPFTTEAFENLTVTFDVQTVVDGNTAEYTIIPSNNDDVWYFYTLPKSTYDNYTDPEGDYRMSEQQFLLFCLEQEINAYRKAGYTDDKILNRIFHKGELKLKATGLNANSEYINQIAGFLVTPEGNITIATDVTTSTYTTGDAKASELTFDISVTDVEMIRAAIKITPSDTKETFCWMCDVWDGEQTAEDIMNGIVAMYGGAMNNGMMLYTGVQDYTGGPGSAFKYKLDSPDTDYYVIAFGYSGGITTEPKMVTFRTLPAPDPATTTFTMSASNITPYSFKISVVPSHSTTYYSFNVCAPEEYNEEAIIAAENEGFDWMLEQAQAFNPDATVAQVLSGYYYRDAAVADATVLAPETDFMGYVVVYNPEDGHVLKLHKFENLATTKAVGSVTPAIEIVGHWSGDDENGAIFKDASATKGKAITVVTYTQLDGARSLFTAMLGDDLTNKNTYSDSLLWKDAAPYWSSCKIAEPYTFYLAEWDAVQTALAYAVDQSTGQPGGIARAYSCATVENKKPIDELFALMEQLYPAKSTASVMVPASVVYEQSNIILSAEPMNVQVAEAEVAEFEAPEAKEFTFPIVRF
ncbi:MAG: hypothetical protein IKJ08_02580 [Alistipes sp.]|nr:hypothetical protein [Alistipes sp.]